MNVSFGVGGSGGNVGNPGAGAGQGHFGLGGLHQQQQSAFSQQQDRQQTLQHNTSMETHHIHSCTLNWRFCREDKSQVVVNQITTK